MGNVIEPIKEGLQALENGMSPFKGLKGLLWGLTLLLSLCTEARHYEVDGIEWNYRIGGSKRAEIKAVSKTTPAIDKETRGFVTVPSKISNYTVSRIGHNAFSNCRKDWKAWGNAHFSDANPLLRCRYRIVRRISRWTPSTCAIRLCRWKLAKAIRSIHPATTSSATKTARNGLLCNKSGTEVVFCPEGLKEVTIPDGVVGISSKAFGYNKNIEKIVIPDSVVYIGLFAFSLCDALAEVYVSERYSGPMDVFPNTATIIRYSPVSSVADDAVQAQSRIIDAMDEYTDVKLVECVSNETQYVAFRKWLNSRSDRFTQWFKDSPNAKFAYILDAYSTFASLPRSEDLKIDGFERGSGSDDFSLSVLVGGIYVGDRALPENLDMLFGVEGSDELSSGGFSSGNVKVEFGTPSDGKMKIKATPRDGAAKSFFFRVKMK